MQQLKAALARKEEVEARFAQWERMKARGEMDEYQYRAFCEKHEPERQAAWADVEAARQRPQRELRERQHLLNTLQQKMKELEAHFASGGMNLQAYLSERSQIVQAQSPIEAEVERLERALAAQTVQELEGLEEPTAPPVLTGLETARPSPPATPGRGISLDLLLRGLDLTLDLRKIGFGVLMVGLAALVGGGMAVLGLRFAEAGMTGAVTAVVCAFLSVFLFVGLLAAAAGGIARMTIVEHTEGRRLGLGEVFAFIFQHLLTFCLMRWAFVLGLALLIGLEMAVAAGLGHLGRAGSGLLTVLSIPLLVLNVFLLFLTFSSVLLECIVAVEGTGTGETLARFVALCRQAPGQVYIGLSLATIFGGATAYFLAMLLILGATVTAMVCLPGSLPPWAEQVEQLMQGR